VPDSSSSRIVVQEIRALPGFERFLLHKEFSPLRSSVHSGPVVILNAAESRCDALIVHADEEGVIHVPLSSFTLKRAGVLQNTLNGLLGPNRHGVIPHDDRNGRRALRRDISWESVLSSLWKGIVKPVLDALDFSVRVVLFLKFMVDALMPPNRLQLPGTYHAYFGVRLDPSHFFLSMQLAFTAPGSRSLDTRYPISSSPHTSLLSVSSCHHELKTPTLVVVSVFLPFLSHHQMVNSLFQAYTSSWNTSRR
jgi:hypothetical protein